MHKDMKFKKDSGYYDIQRNELIKMLPSIKGRYLEIGCGAGATLEYLKKNGADYVAGIDISAEAIEKAKERDINTLIVADVEKNDLPFSGKEFNCIILADVLEHLYDPWFVLERVSQYLSDDGCLLLSVPNIRNYIILWRLIAHNEWSYREGGVLDNTHIRFFTLPEIKKMLDSISFKIEKVESSSYMGKYFKIINAILLNTLRSLSVGQYFILARK